MIIKQLILIKYEQYYDLKKLIIFNLFFIRLYYIKNNEK